MIRLRNVLALSIVLAFCFAAAGEEEAEPSEAGKALLHRVAGCWSYETENVPVAEPDCPYTAKVNWFLCSFEEAPGRGTGSLSASLFRTPSIEDIPPNRFLECSERLGVFKITQSTFKVALRPSASGDSVRLTAKCDACLPSPMDGVPAEDLTGTLRFQEEKFTSTFPPGSPATWTRYVEKKPPPPKESDVGARIGARSGPPPSKEFCSDLAAISKEAASKFQALRGEAIDDESWRGALVLPGTSRCLTSTVAGSAPDYWCIVELPDEEGAKAEQAQFEKLVEGCLGPEATAKRSERPGSSYWVTYRQGPEQPIVVVKRRLRTGPPPTWVIRVTVEAPE